MHKQLKKKAKERERETEIERKSARDLGLPPPQVERVQEHVQNIVTLVSAPTSFSSPQRVLASD
jgi:hypothetical protein